ncbi:MAG: serine/threonine dehydratase [Ignavibacteriaceae bacterium]|nr:MAG: pyridoxal-phosphate dependent enzyme [Chlorobiota bacterium]GJQ33254.1 MAG: serine/threonine dehydratase [Ignavibacteriaceae bacterium]
MSEFPTADSIVEAHERISGYIHRTPVLTSRSLNALTGAELFFKCENMQRGGAFKARGAFNASLSLTPEERKNGIATHSSGNHATALSLAGQTLGVPAYVVMPSNSKKIKVASVQAFGGRITFCEPNLKAREETLAQVISETGAAFIPPYDDYRIIRGQATAAKELVEDIPGLERVIAPVGGGGLLAGTALSSRYFGKNIEVFAAEPEGANDAWKSMQAGCIVPSVNPDTFSDGLLTSLGTRNFPVIKELVQEIITVSDREIIAAMRLIWERLKIVAEPSSATVLAAVIKAPHHFSGKRTGLILSGGNVDLAETALWFNS